MAVSAQDALLVRVKQGSTLEASGAERQHYAAEMQKKREILDLLRSLHHIYGTSVLGL